MSRARTMAKSTLSQAALAQAEPPKEQMPEQLAEETIRRMMRVYTSTFESARARAAEFASDDVAKIFYALEWAGSTFETTAKAWVWAHSIAGIWSVLAEGKSAVEALAFVREYALVEALRATRCPARSTSACSNLAEQCKGAAWAEMVEFLKWEGVS